MYKTYLNSLFRNTPTYDNFTDSECKLCTIYLHSFSNLFLSLSCLNTKNKRHVTLYISKAGIKSTGGVASSWDPCCVDSGSNSSNSLLEYSVLIFVLMQSYFFLPAIFWMHMILTLLAL